MKARDIMTSPAFTIRDLETVGHAAQIMAEQGISALPVVDAEGRIVGIVSHTDFFLQPVRYEALAYRGINRPHQAVKHSVGEFVRAMAHTNGMESHWAMLKRGHDGVYHHFSHKHLPRYITEFEGRHNNRPMDTADQMARMAQGADGKRLPYADLIGPKSTTQPAML